MSIFDYKPEPWVADAACAGYPLDWFFPDDRGRAGAAGSDTTRAAKAICAACPVQTACLDYSIRTDTREGVWGGLLADERRELMQDGAA
jgi:WhiB family transcriptional regulator, redox-sensing transcriptional regulator